MLHSLASILWLVAICLANLAAAHSLRVEVQTRFANVPLIFDLLTNVTASGQTLSVTRLDFLLSDFVVHRTDGAWIASSNRFACINGREGRTEFTLPALPAGEYDRVRFYVGVPERENHADPGGLAASHPLNPNVNGLHWSWQGGYVFLALEGKWSGEERGYSYHIATDGMLMTVELPLTLQIDEDLTLDLALNADRILSGKHTIQVTDATTSTHSRPGDALAAQLRENIEGAFSIISVSGAGKARTPENRVEQRKLLIASNATPYRFTFSRFFPQPALPSDNPLTEEGVELGRRLFHEPRLSINNRQSCASCHQADAAFTDGKRVSLGAEGQSGSRNAMPLLNLAWKDSFFWDGRAPTLREQVLIPIQNPIEMHEMLTNVVAKLLARDSSNENHKPEIDYPTLFSRAFDSPEITGDRIARALEQFLLVQVSHRSKFDRSLSGEVELSAEEKRGFDLFHTEYDPRRGQYGADCFHCHGGPLFRSQGFANNGLDGVFHDAGRFDVTKREADRGKFSVPSLRNVAQTRPYMHDGRIATLEEVVEHYISGVKRSASLDPNLAKHPDGGVPLTGDDKRALVAFLKTLTDERSIANRDEIVRMP